MTMTRRSVIAAAAAAPAAAAASRVMSASLGVQAEFFDPQYYANHNADLLVAGIKDYAGLRAHWLSHGIAEGRMAHPEFNAPAYRSRYADLRAAFGANTSAYYTHYVQHGQYEGRNARGAGLIARLGDVSIGASPRCAGAVDSLFFHGKDSINSYDHGRQLQTACYDTRYHACFNPTQAGGISDGLGNTSSSQLIYGDVSNGGRTLHTKTRAAFWTRPGHTITDQGMIGCTAKNTTAVSEFIADTKYTLKARNNVTVVEYDMSWKVGANIPANHFMAELSTGYHTSDFSVGYEVVAENGYAARLRHMGDHLGNTGQERLHPCILTVPNGSRAVGVYAPPEEGALTRYATWLWRFGQNQQTNDCTKWSIVRRYHDAVVTGQVVPARCYIVMGQVTDVHLELARLMKVNLP